MNIDPTVTLKQRLKLNYWKGLSRQIASNFSYLLKLTKAKAV